MKDATVKKLLVGLIVILLVVGAYSFGKRQGDEGDDLKDVLTPQTAEDKQIDAEIAAEDQAMTKVMVRKNGFEPATVTIKKGQKIEWVNNSGGDVTPVYTPFALEDSVGDEGDDASDENDSWEVGFTKAGTYHYYDGLHPERKGTVVVTE